MKKWADFLISAVRYKTKTHKRGHIEEVKVHKNLRGKVGPGKKVLRSDIAAIIDSGNSCITILKDATGKWRKGQVVCTIKMRSGVFIRTVANRTASDNLRNLPRF
jgi:hypothetical protein